jgi:hypothetical protein
VKDPDGGDLQISNGNGLAKARKAAAATAKLTAPLPFETTGWKTVWLDHFSFNAANYKKTASFYRNLLRWKETYDEGSQNELLIGETGDIIIRGATLTTRISLRLPLRRRAARGSITSCYHTATPNGYNLQISFVTRDDGLTLANAVKPKK